VSFDEFFALKTALNSPQSFFISFSPGLPFFFQDESLRDEFSLTALSLFSA